jgi:hypothetical protein
MAVAVAMIDDRLAAGVGEQEAHDLGVPSGRRCLDQRGGVAARGDGRVGPPLQEQAHHMDRARRGQGFAVHGCSFIQEPPRDLNVAISDGPR